MAYKRLREEAIKLRLQGYTYSQIKHELNISKSTLSGWLKNLPLSETSLKILSKNKELSKDIRIERFRQTARNKWITRLTKVLDDQGKKMLPLTEKELFLAGVFLYWGEGSKQRGIVAVSNSDPRVIRFMLFWMTKIIKVPKEKLKIRLHLYNDMNIDEEIGFWSRSINISRSQFNSPYIKKSTRDSVTYKSFGHGTCNLIYCSMEVSERIAMSIKAISDFYGEKSDLFWYN